MVLGDTLDLEVPVRQNIRKTGDSDLVGDSCTSTTFMICLLLLVLILCEGQIINIYISGRRGATLEEVAECLDAGDRAGTM